MPRDPRLPLFVAAACLVSACSPTLTIVLDGDASAEDDVRRLLDAFEVRDRQVTQVGNEVRVRIGDDRDKVGILAARGGLDRIIAADEAAPEPMVDAPGAGALRFVPTDSKVLLQAVSYFNNAARLCVWEADLGRGLPEMRMSFEPLAGSRGYDPPSGPPMYADVASVYATSTLTLAGQPYDSGARGLALAGTKAQFVFDVKAESPAVMDMPIAGEESFRACATQILREASGDFIARAMFPKLAKSAVSYH